MRAVYCLARADFLERVRRYSFLLTLAGAGFFCYHVHTGNLSVHVSGLRGTMNSAWLGAVMTLVASIFLALFGFYIVKNTVRRDERTGVGQILAATPMTGAQYVFGKALSNFALLAFMVAVLAVSALPLQWLAGEDPRIDLWKLLSPFLLIALPMMMLVAALAILFETVGWLRGGFGNVMYFFLFIGMLSVVFEKRLIDPTGLTLLQPGIEQAARAAHPEVHGFGFGAGPHRAERGFHWDGLVWTPRLVAERLVGPGLGLALCLVAVLCFQRFDPSSKRRKPSRAGMPEALPEPVPERPSVRLQALSPVDRRPAAVFALWNELRLLLKGQRWWWYAGAGGTILAGFLVPRENLGIVLTCAWIWPVLVWSPMGNREVRHGAAGYIFIAPRPLARQLPGLWLAGVAVAAGVAGGAALRWAALGDWRALGACLTGALVPPSLALVLGVCTSSAKTFEIVYTLVWYLGPANHLPGLDFTFHSRNAWLLPWCLALVPAFLLLAFLGRARALRR